MQQQRSSLPLTPFIGGACILAAIGILISGSATLALAIICMGGTFLLMGGKPEAWAGFPLWRRLAVFGCLALGAVALLVAFLSGFSH